MRNIIFLIFVLSLSQIFYNCSKSTEKKYTIQELRNEYTEEDVYKELISRQDNHDKIVKPNEHILKNPELKEYSIDTLYAYYKSIYGKDNRKNIYEEGIDSLTKVMALKVACLIKSSSLKNRGDGTFEIISEGRLGNLLGLCESEMFTNEPVASFCSGFAISRNLFATAGHCLDDENLNEIRIIYGFRMIDKNIPNLIIPASDIYEPTRIVKRKLDKNTLEDFTIVEVNKEFPDHKIVQIRKNDKVKIGEELFVIGYPSGIPLKIAADSKVLKNDNNFFFVTNTDTFGGNSGSPVFNKNNNTVEGILVRGHDDYMLVKISNCSVTVKCPQSIGNCTGESVSRTSQFWDVIK